MRKITTAQLREIILETVQEVKHERRQKRDAQYWGTIAEKAARGVSLNEHTIPDKSADINDMDAGAVWDIMTGDDAEEAQSLLDRIGSATGWGSGALEKAGVTAETLKDKAEEIFKDKDTFSSRVSGMVAKLDAAEGFSKPEMPALEGGDLSALQDAFDEEGEFNVDIGSDFGGGTASFTEYMEDVGGEEDKIREESIENKGPLMVERWRRIAGLEPINDITADERFPFPGPAKTMAGAPKLDADADIDLSALDGAAKAFMTKGKGNAGDDINIQANQPMKNGKMKPTQTNVKAAKSMLFALANIGQDMGGAYASSEGEIIDGHHRWSGQWLRSGGDAEMTNVNIIDKGDMSTKEFLTMLTVVGNAMGRPTKLS